MADSMTRINIQNRIIEALKASLQKKLNDCLHLETLAAPPRSVEPSVSMIHVANQESGEQSTDTYELLIDNYAYKVLMKSEANDRFIVSETFTDNEIGKRQIHILMVSLLNGEMTIHYKVHPETNTPRRVSPTEIQSTPDNATDAEKEAIRREHYTRIPQKQSEEILATLNAPNHWMDVKIYRDTNPMVESECFKLFGRRNLASIYTQFPEFLQKVSGKM